VALRLVRLSSKSARGDRRRRGPADGDRFLACLADFAAHQSAMRAEVPLAGLPFADVVELIAGHDLGPEFAARLHKAVRKTFRRLVKNARGQA